MQDCAADREIRTLLGKFGLCGKEKGYEKLFEAIELTVENFERAGSVTKLLYPELAKQFQTTPQKIERSIRHLVERSWMNGDTEQFDEVFGYCRMVSEEHPTNSEYIAVLADVVRRERRASL